MQGLKPIARRGVPAGSCGMEEVFGKDGGMDQSNLAPEAVCWVPPILTTTPFLLGCPSGHLFLVLRGLPAQPSPLQWARSPTPSIEGPSHHGTSHRIHPTAAILTPPPSPTVVAELDFV